MRALRNVRPMGFPGPGSSVLGFHCLLFLTTSVIASRGAPTPVELLCLGQTVQCDPMLEDAAPSGVQAVWHQQHLDQQVSDAERRNNLTLAVLDRRAQQQEPKEMREAESPGNSSTSTNDRDSKTIVPDPGLPGEKEQIANSLGGRPSSANASSPGETSPLPAGSNASTPAVPDASTTTQQGSTQLNSRPSRAAANGTDPEGARSSTGVLNGGSTSPRKDGLQPPAKPNEQHQSSAKASSATSSQDGHDTHAPPAPKSDLRPTPPPASVNGTEEVMRTPKEPTNVPSASSVPVDAPANNTLISASSDAHTNADGEPNDASKTRTAPGNGTDASSPADSQTPRLPAVQDVANSTSPAVNTSASSNASHAAAHPPPSTPGPPDVGGTDVPIVTVVKTVPANTTITVTKHAAASSTNAAPVRPGPNVTMVKVVEVTVPSAPPNSKGGRLNSPNGARGLSLMELCDLRTALATFVVLTLCIAAFDAC